MFIVTTALRDNSVRTYNTTSGRLTQSIPHPRPVRDILWRVPRTSSRDDLMLYTVTTDGTIRIFLPVLDQPNYLQLHGALDAYSSLPLSFNPSSRNSTSPTGFIFDREVMFAAFTRILKDCDKSSDDSGVHRLREIQDEGWDIFFHVHEDRSLVIGGVANIDRRPPTLLRNFTLSQTSPGVLNSHPVDLRILPYAESDKLMLISNSPLESYEVCPVSFFGSRPDGIKLAARMGGLLQDTESWESTLSVSSTSPISRFVRTAEGRCIGVVREEGIELQIVGGHGTQLVRKERSSAADSLVVLDKGRSFATYDETSSILTLHSEPLLTLTIPTVKSLFATVINEQTFILGITPDYLIVRILVDIPDSPPIASLSPTSAHSSPATLPSLELISVTKLPLHDKEQPNLKFIIPVDPMRWTDLYNPGTKTQNQTQIDALLSVSKDGELIFWAPEDQSSPASSRSDSPLKSSGEVDLAPKTDRPFWRRTGTVRTGRKGLRTAACSSTKKSVLVVPLEEGEELTIWDSKESEFASGLEFRRVFDASEPINDLDWSATPDNQSILAVGFNHHVEVICQKRMTYFNEDEGWDTCWKLELWSMIPHRISDSIWTAYGSLLVGAGPHMFLYGQPKSQSKIPVVKNGKSKPTPREGLWEYVARENGPLEQFHPQMLLQCLLWDKLELVKDIIVALAKHLDSGAGMESWVGLNLDLFLNSEKGVVNSYVGKRRAHYGSLFAQRDFDLGLNDEDIFSRPLVQRLLERLDSNPLPHLTPNEQAHLSVLIETTLEVEEQRRALDPNGLRYLISMRSFYILNQRLRPSVDTDSVSVKSAATAKTTGRAGRRERLRYKEMIWAFHSESQDLLLSASVTATGGKMRWCDARALGVFVWLSSTETMKAHLEVIARNEYMNDDRRDPTECSLFYFALGKVKLVHGLWRQAAWHKEQQLMLKFLSNNFSQQKWKTVAMKNAYALLSKQRWEYAAAFFLLGGALRDAVRVCLKQVGDVQLAIALARVVEGNDDGPVLQEILRETVVPLAFKDGNRWLASWAFWLLHRRDLAVRILVTPLEDIAKVLDVPIPSIGEPHYDDTSLALLFSQLKMKTLQTAKGTSEISGRTEFNFVLQIARVFCRMGCHILALDLVKSWSFVRPAGGVSATRANLLLPPTPRSPTAFTVPFAMAANTRRESKILIDMDMITEPPTRRASPEPEDVNELEQRAGAKSSELPRLSIPGTRAGSGLDELEHLKDEGDLLSRKAGLGSLIKNAKQNVQVPEFDMSSFGF